MDSNGSDALAQAVIGAAIEVQGTLGNGLLGSIYEEVLCHEFDRGSILS